MKKLSVIIAGLVFVFGLSNVVVAQDNETASHDIGISIPSIALVDIEGNASINLTVSATGLEAGEAVDFSSAVNSSLWLNYTAIINENEREISAKITSDNLPDGVTLKLKVNAAVAGKGKLGEIVSEDPVNLSGTQLSIINGIGSCFTGDGTGSGHQLTYSLEMDDDSYEDLESGEEYSATVVYTISETN